MKIRCCLEQMYEKQVWSLNSFVWHSATLGYGVFDHDSIIAKLRHNDFDSGQLSPR